MRRKRALGVVLASAVAFAAAAHVTACGNGANDVAGCQELENARCARATECGIDLGLPLHDSNIDAVTACQLYYQDACLHGFVTTVAITSEELGNCEKAISVGNCNAVLNPQTVPACSWLNPPDAGSDVVDAATSADVATTTPDVGAVTVVDSGADTGDAFGACYAQCTPGCVDDPNCLQECEANCNMM
jgi:hypothetical protein